MSDLPANEVREERILDTLASRLGYFTVSIGYLSTILRTAHLTLPNFLAFTVLQVCYCTLLWWMMRSAGQGSSMVHLVLSVVLLVGITVLVGLMPLAGLQWDWLLFLVTIATSFLIFPLRLALGIGILLYVLLMGNLFVIDAWNWSLVYPSLMELLPAFAFVAVFSLMLHFQWIQGDRTERLLRQLEESNAELERAHRKLQEYADEVEDLTIVRERTRVAREIHDTLGHHLSILNIQLEMISKLQARDPARAAVEIVEARRVATQSMQEVRNAVAALRSTSIATLSLPQAITRLANECEHGMEGVQIILDLETQLPQLTPDVQVAFYRAAQEAFTNVRKHSQASKVLARLRYEDELLELLMLDNGPALPSSENDGGFGLVGLRERFELLGGQVEYGHAGQGGFRVLVQAPVLVKTRQEKRDAPLLGGSA